MEQVKEKEMTEEQKAAMAKEKADHAVATLDLLYKLNLIAVKIRESGTGFLAGQKPSKMSADKPVEKQRKAVEAGVAESEGEDGEFMAIAKVDFPDEKNPTQFGETAGVHSWILGKKYPMRGFAISETVDKLGTFKRIARLSMERMARHKIRTALMFVLFKKVWEEIAISLFEGFYWGMKKHLLKSNRWCQPVREIRRVMIKLAAEDGILSKTHPDTIGFGQPLAYIKRTICAILEFDDAYRYRLQWLPWNPEAVAKRPVRELRKMFGMLYEREEDERLRQQWKVFKQAVWILAFHRPSRRYIQRFFRELNADEIKLSVEDKYHAVTKSSFKWDLPPQESYH